MRDIHALIERLYALFNARELEEAAAFFADDAVLEHGASGKAPIHMRANSRYPSGSSNT